MKKNLMQYKNSKVLKNSAWLIFDKVVRLLSGLIVGAAVARYLGPEQYGLLNFSTAFTSLFISFSMLGIDNLVIRELNDVRYKSSVVLGTAMRIRNIGSIFAGSFALLIGYVFYGNQSYFFYLVIIFMCGNIVQSMDVLSLWYQAQTKSKVIVKNKLFAYIIVAIVKLLAIYCGMNLLWFGACTVFEYIIGVLFMVCYYRMIDKNVLHDWRFSKDIAWRLVKEGWPLAVSGLSVIIFMKADQILIGNYLGDRAVGIYSIASLVSDILYSIPVFISSSAFPKLTKIYQENYEMYRIYCEKLFFGIVAYSYISLIFIYCFIDIFILGLYGEVYVEAIDVVKVHSLTLVFVSIGCIRGIMMIIENKTSLLSIITIFSGVISITLNLISIPHFGIVGAATSVLIAQILSGYIGNIFFKELRYIFIIQTKMILLFPIWHNKLKTEKS